jgi:hypothetical protein
LQNQFALREFGFEEKEALAKYRAWLWGEMKDKYNVVVHEMRDLVRAHHNGAEVDVKVPKDALHGAMIVNALLWLANNLPPQKVSPIHTSDPSPLYEPILPDGTISTRADIDPKHIVWVTGRTQSKIGVIVGWNEVFVPGVGVLNLKDLEMMRWVNRDLASSPIMQERLNNELDQLFGVEAATTPPEYDAAPEYNTYDRDSYGGEIWEQSADEELEQKTAIAQAERDNMTQIEQLAEELGDIDTALEVANLPDIENWHVKHAPLPSYADEKIIRPVYKYKGEKSPLMIKTIWDQVNGNRFRPANREETQEFIRAFRQIERGG